MSTVNAQPSACGPSTSHKKRGTPASRMMLIRFGMVRMRLVSTNSSPCAFTNYPLPDSTTTVVCTLTAAPYRLRRTACAVLPAPPRRTAFRNPEEPASLHVETAPNSKAAMMIRNALAGTLAGAAAMALAILPASTASAHESGGDLPTADRGVNVADAGVGKEMSPVANLQYDDSGEAQSGSDIEFVKVGKKEYALSGTLRKGMQIVDITDPANPSIAAVYDCDISQGDVQVWKHGKRILASYTADGTFGAAGAASQCARDLDLGSDASGTVIVDITTPTSPQTVSYVHVPRGSHNMTIHPSGDYLYNSNSDLITSTSPAITIYDISDPENPKKVQDFAIPFVPLSLGSESHDITFNEDGTRAYSAALSQTLVLDTTSPEQPKIISQILDPAINVVHGSDPVTLTGEDGTEREVLVIADERAGAAASAECPGGGLHLYDITGDKEASPEKIGTWFIPAATVQDGSTCTSHVLRIYPRQKMMTIAWY